MSIQTTYNETLRAGLPGLVATQYPASFISRTVETAAGIAFGKAAAQGAADDGAIAYAGAGYLGLAVREHSVDPANGDKFAQYDTGRFLTKGAIWVDTADAVVAGAPVYVTPAGAFTDASSGNFAIPRARFDTSTSGAGLALVRID